MRLLLAALLLATAPLNAQESPALTKALDYLKTNHERHLAKQVEITEVPAPTFHEGERAKFMAAEFRRVGLKDVVIDKQGNVVGWRPGASPDALVIAAHLDISFEEGVNTKVRKAGRRWMAPGIHDDSRGLMALLALVESLDYAGIKCQKTLLFVANVGEEGLGDLNGVKYLFQASPYRSRLKAFISIDAAGDRLTNGGTGVKRYLVTLRGPGGHSYGSFGRPSAAHALGRIIAGFTSLEVPKQPKTTYNVGKIGGGTLVNAIAEEAWMEVDLRSESIVELDRLERKFMEWIATGVTQENEFRAASKETVKAETKLIGDRPAGVTKESDPLVQAAMAAVKANGGMPEIGISSTDSNLPMSLGIPAITMGGGGRGGNAHSLEEWFEPEDAYKGIQVVLRTILSYDAVR